MSRRAWLSIGLAVLLVAAGLGGWAWWRSSHADELRVGTYSATVRGTGPDGKAFEARGELRIRPTIDELPYQWCLKVGLPAGDPKPGAIWFGSDGSCFGAGRRSPVVTWRESGGEYVLAPLNPPPKVTESLNMFYATTVVMAEANQPDGGDLRFRAQGSTLTGTINLQGVALGNARRGAYAATLEASFVSGDPEAPVHA
jgi:hypothetical protein